MVNPDIVAVFVPPTEEEISRIIAEDSGSLGEVNRETIQKEIDRAKGWLEDTAKKISMFIILSAKDGDQVSACLVYREGEDLGYGCNNPGHSPFNNVYNWGPTVHLVLKGNVTVAEKMLFERNVTLETFYPRCEDGNFLLMLYVLPLRMYVVIRNE